ncbi:hypothetical protein Vretimale_8509 [Volvox reticuliferus]|uniref:Uncharacterized protein n=1 Tax=Volvox reticuliferus TaxID=1737510 RepID=A0A8J4GAW3_9CHLO|nr:hypothetical protein Vretimale_8509 [Volvox reticuliferus]
MHLHATYRSTPPTQLAACLAVLQRLLRVPPPVAAAMLAAQPALALQPPAALAVAVDFLAANFSPAAFARASSAAAVAPAESSAATADVFETLSRHHQQRQHLNKSISRGSFPNYAQRRRLQQSPLPTQLLQQQQQPQQQQLLLAPLQVQRLVQRCPDVLLLEPRLATTALDVLTRVLENAATDGNFGVNADGDEWELGLDEEVGMAVRGGEESEESEAEARVGLIAAERTSRWAWQMALSMAIRAPRLLLCRLIPPAQAGGGGGVAPPPARSRQTTIMSLVKAIGEAQRKRRIDATALALDSPYWPRPLVALPQVYGAGAVAPTAGDVSDASVLDGPGGGVIAHSNESALTAAAAAAGVCPVPIDLGLREAELLRILLPGQSTPPGSEVMAWQPGSTASYGSPGWLGSRDGSAWDAGVGGSGGAAIIRSWLWRQVLAAEPGLLLVPSTQLSAAVAALCAWMAVPVDALSYYLFPSGVARLRSAIQQERGTSSTEQEVELEDTSSSRAPLRLRRNHVALLTRDADTIQRAGCHLWSWLSGGAAVSAADVAAVLRAQPGLLYDSATMLTCGRVLHALLGGMSSYGNDGAGAIMTDANKVTSELPEWARVSPPGNADPWVGTGQGFGAATGKKAQDTSSSPPPPSLPMAAVSLLLQFAGEVLSEGVLQLLAVEPMAAASEAATTTEVWLAEAPVVTHGRATLDGDGDTVRRGPEVTADTSPSPGGGTRLDRAVGMLTKLLGIGRLAAAALVLSTRGSAALMVEQLSPAAVASVERAMLAIRRGDAWRREMRRYLFGSTSYGGVGFSEQSLQGGESLRAVSASAQELLVVLWGWRRVARLEALEAAGLQDAASFAMVLQLPDDDWSNLAHRLQLSP